jgi:phosphoribosylaminoimidazolecarboxamide formyltransferase/IMP cyclohydrolase
VGHDVTGSSLASDAFFPFPDGPRLALDAGTAAIVQPGGSRRDDDVIAEVEGAGAVMVFAGRRHFRH